MLSLLSDRGLVEALPAPADAEQARLGLERWRDIDHDPELTEYARALADDPAGNQLLCTLFGNSPFLTQCCLREPEFLRHLLQYGPDASFAELIDALNDQSSDSGHS
ncbi:MAG: hypothetical protein JO255_09360, partial [Alphaproteobacteria bacterium]|nr:hypothetical protein [Alphaproteobacteria bacterium]